MVPIHKIIGRLSNQMFITAAHYVRCRETGEHFFAQDEKYFEKYKDEIKQIFGGGITVNSVGRVAIHRRLTDYVGNSFYVDLGHHEHEKLEENYFMRAMAEFPEDTEFTVFSDDIETAKKEPMFQGEKFKFSTKAGLVDAACKCNKCNGDCDSGKKGCSGCVENHLSLSEVDDLNLMASHKGIIGSNSSYSWWGAYLSGADKIIFPRGWFSNPEDDQYIGLPNTWIRI